MASNNFSRASQSSSGARMVGDQKVYRQAQPNGEAGVRFSLGKVAEKIAEGRLHPMVRSWTTKVLAKVGNPKGPRKRAAAILEALRTVEGFPKASRWVPDPHAAEYIAGAHLTLGDGDTPPLFALGDCDDLTVAFGSAVLAPVMYLAAAESVGANAAVVGHAYGKDRMIEHVLGAIYDEGRWWYADPSVKDLPLGECKPFTRERVYLVPSMELLCDASVCLRGNGPAVGPPPPPRHGDFVSVDGLPGQDEAEDDGPRTLMGFCDLSGCCGKDEIDTLAQLARQARAEHAISPAVRQQQSTETLRRAARDAQNQADAARAASDQAQAALDSAEVALEQQAAQAQADFAQASMAQRQQAAEEAANAHAVIDLQQQAAQPRADAARGQRPEAAQSAATAHAQACAEVTAANADEAHQAAHIKAAELQNQACFQQWADAPCADNPLAWNIINVPPQTDYAAQELFQPWHDGLEPYSGESWEIKGSSFLQPPKV
jgi:hypothetical protein